MKSNRASVRQIQVTAIYSRAVLDAVTSECRVKMVICKTRTGTLANSGLSSDAAKRGVCSGSAVCLDYRKLRVKWNILKSLFRTLSRPKRQLSVLWYAKQQSEPFADVWKRQPFKNMFVNEWTSMQKCSCKAFYLFIFFIFFFFVNSWIHKKIIYLLSSALFLDIVALYRQLK